MISNAVIKKYGLDTDSLKKYFTAKVPDGNVAKLNQLIADRIHDGRLRNLTDYKIWAAVDFAYDAPFAQTTPTLIRGIMESCKSAEDVLKALRGWGLKEEELLVRTEVEGGVKWELNEPVFFNVFVPLVRAYVTVRCSKLFNDRNLTPLFEFPPREFTAENRLICKVLTEIVESVAVNFGYASTLRDFIFNALMYSLALKFPVERWSKYKREDDDGNEITEKEGIRYVIPHISRSYYDMTYSLNTFNTGTGCSYAGYWTILKWGEVAMNEELWNRNSVPHGTNWLDPNAQWYNYFKEVYPCTLEFPQPKTSRRNDRENMAFRYTRTDFDSAFFLTYHFQELVPRDWGLGDYPHPVWMRFMIGGDSTIMFAETLNSRPIDYIGYDADSGRGRNASLALEILPYQDITGNVLSQFLMSIKRNLANIVFYDTDAIDNTTLETLKKRSNAQFNGLNFVGYSGLAMDREQSSIEHAFKEVKFSFVNTGEILTGLNTVIAILERLLVISSQEIGASASHQQSKKEVELTAANTSNRVAYTGSFVDEGIEAWKRSLAESIICNMEGKDVVATIPADIPNLQDALTKLGFELAEPQQPGHAKVVVKGKISSLKLVQFVARRSDAVRENDMQAATLMMQTVQSIANSQILSQIVDPTSLLEMLEYAAKLGGADDDFKVRLNSSNMMANKLQELVQQIQQQIMQAVEKEAVQPAAQAIGQLKNEVEQDKQAVATEVAQLKVALTRIAQAVTGSVPPPIPAPMGQPQPPMANLRPRPLPQ